MTRLTTPILALLLLVVLVPGAVSPGRAVVLASSLLPPQDRPIAAAGLTVLSGETSLRQVWSQDDGVFATGPLEARLDHTVVVGATDYVTAAVSGVPVVGGQEVSLAITMDYGVGDVRGQVRDRLSGEVVSGALVTLKSGAELLGHTTTGGDGWFSMPALPVIPDVSLEVATTGYLNTQLSSFPIRPGLTTTLALALEPALGGLAGTVTDRVSGGRIASATVTLRLPDQTLGTTTDGEGRYAFSGVEAVTSASVEVTAPGYVTLSMGSAPVLGGRVTPMDLELSPVPADVTAVAGAIAGTVRNRVTGAPLTGGTVYLYPHGASTYTKSAGISSSGTYSITAVDPNPADLPYRLQVTSSGYAGSWVTGVMVSGGHTTVLDLTTWPTAGTLSGTVRDGITGNPLTGGTVYLYPHGTSTYSKSASISSSGTYTLSSVGASSADGPYTLKVSTSGYKEVWIVGVAVDGGHTTVLDLKSWPAAGTLSGTVQDGVTGVNVNSGSVYLYTHGSSTYARNTVISSSGTFSFTSVTANRANEPYRLQIVRSGHADVWVMGVMVAGGHTTSVQLKSWPTAGTLSGTVRDGVSGGNLNSGSVYLYAHGSSTYARNAGISSGGTFSITSVGASAADGPYNLRITRSGHVDVWVTGAMVRGGLVTDIDLTIWPSSGTLTGTVRDGVTGSHVNSGTVYLYPYGSSTHTHYANILSTGAFSLSSLEATAEDRPYRLRVTRSGYTDTWVSGVMVRGGLVTDLSLSVWPHSGTITGTVRDAVTGNNLNSGTVYLYPHGSASYTKYANVLSNGTFTLTTVAATEASAPYRLRVTRSGYQDAWVTDVMVAGGRTTDLNVYLLADMPAEVSASLPTAGSVSGKIVDIVSGLPVANARLLLQKAGRSDVQGYADVDGNFSFSDVPAGLDYQLHVQAEGHVAYSHTGIAVHGGRDTATGLLLEPALGSISGRVVDAFTGLPMANAQLRLRNADRADLQGTTSAAGDFIFTDLPAGLGYALEIEAQGYVPYTYSGLPVRGGHDSWVRLAVAPARGSLSGTVSERRPIGPTVPAYVIAAAADPTGGGTVSGSGAYLRGETVGIKATPAAGYAFAGWKENSVVVSSSSTYVFVATAERNLVASFEPLGHVVETISSPAEGGTTSGRGVYQHGSEVTVTAAANDGYDFIAWMEEGTEVGAEASYSFIVTSSKTLVASFGPRPYAVTTGVFPAGAGTVTGGGTHHHGDQVTVTATPSAGYAFVNWEENGLEAGTEPVYTFTATSDRTLVANFSAATCAVELSSQPQEGGTTTGSGSYLYGDQVTATATPAPGYVFAGWFDQDEQVGSDPVYVFTVETHRHLVATFNLRTYTLAVDTDPPGVGTVTGGGAHLHGERVTVTAAAPPGYRFAGWVEGGQLVSVDAELNFAIESERTLTAVFSPAAPNVADLAALTRHYRLNRDAAGWEPALDLNGDGSIDLRDLVTLARTLAP
jgi:hypothetical protein